MDAPCKAGRSIQILASIILLNRRPRPTQSNNLNIQKVTQIISSMTMAFHPQMHHIFKFQGEGRARCQFQCVVGNREGQNDLLFGLFFWLHCEWEPWPPMKGKSRRPGRIFRTATPAGATGHRDTHRAPFASWQAVRGDAVIWNTFDAGRHHPIATVLVGNLLRPRRRVGAKWDFHDAKKVEEYLGHASGCRTSARAAPQAHRQRLEDMAQTWEQLAEARKREIKKQLKAKYARTTLGVDVPVAD